MAFRKESVASSTKRNRDMQWKCYLSVCNQFGWEPVPCSVGQACMYVSFLADKMRLSSIKTYYQAVVFVHTCLGIEPVPMSNPMLKSTLKGIGNVFGNVECSKDPIFPEHLGAIARIVNEDCELELVVFVAMLFLFRTLLRVSHVVTSDHTLTMSDVKFNGRGMLVMVRTAKNLKSKDKKLFVPVVFSPQQEICACIWVLKMTSKYPRPKGAPLFAVKGNESISYSVFSKVFKDLVSRAELKGDFASHSLRRGGATLMSMKGCHNQLSFDA